MSKRYHHMGDMFAVIRNREQCERVDIQNMMSAFRIVTGFAQSFQGRGPFEVDDESIAAWIEGLFDEGSSRGRETPRA